MWRPIHTTSAFSYGQVDRSPLGSRKPTPGGGELSSKDLIWSIRLFTALCNPLNFSDFFLGFLILQDTVDRETLPGSDVAPEVS